MEKNSRWLLTLTVFYPLCSFVLNWVFFNCYFFTRALVEGASRSMDLKRWRQWICAAPEERGSPSKEEHPWKMMHHGIWSSKLWATISCRGEWQHGKQQRRAEKRLALMKNSLSVLVLLWMFDSPVCGRYTHLKDPGDGTTVCIVMLLLHFFSAVSRFGFFSKICAIPVWLALKTNCPAATEAAVPRARPEGPTGSRVPRGARGCTSRRWPREPGPWPFTTPFPSNRTASPLTALCSSSVRIISYGNMPKRSPNGHILTAQCNTPFRDHNAELRPKICPFKLPCLPADDTCIKDMSHYP